MIPMNKVKLFSTIVIVILLIICTYYFGQMIKSIIINRNLYYSDLTRVTTEEQLQYVINNKINNFLISGIATTNEEFTLPELNQSFTGIMKTEYKYESYVRTYTTTDSEGKSHTHTKTEWEWVRKGTSTQLSTTATLLGKTFYLANLPYQYTTVKYTDIGNLEHKKDGKYKYTDDKARYEYKVIPLSWNVTMECTSDLTMVKNFYGKSIDDVVKPWGITWITVFQWIFSITYVVIGIYLNIKWYLEDNSF